MIEKILVNGEEHGITLADNMIGEGLSKASDGSISVTIEGGGEFVAEDVDGVGIKIPYGDIYYGIYLSSNVNIGIPNKLNTTGIQIGTYEASSVRIGKHVTIGGFYNAVLIDGAIEIGKAGYGNQISIGTGIGDNIKVNGQVAIEGNISIGEGSTVRIGPNVEIGTNSGDVKIKDGVELGGSGGTVKIGTYGGPVEIIGNTFIKNPFTVDLDNTPLSIRGDKWCVSFGLTCGDVKFIRGTEIGIEGCGALQIYAKEDGVYIRSDFGTAKMPWQST